MEFIPFNEQTATQFEEKLSRNLLYRGTDNFIAIYNNNLINRNNDEIDKVAKSITEVYKNVSLVNKKFIVKSKEEVVAETFEVLFPHIAFVATLKRIVSDIFRDNYPENVKLVFTESEQNVVQILQSDDELISYEGAERLKNANKAISNNPFILNQVDISPYGEDGIALQAIDILQIDTSFINEIGELLNVYLGE